MNIKEETLKEAILNVGCIFAFALTGSIGIIWAGNMLSGNPTNWYGLVAFIIALLIAKLKGWILKGGK